jgi:hypothetical protein
MNDVDDRTVQDQPTLCRDMPTLRSEGVAEISSTTGAGKPQRKHWFHVEPHVPVFLDVMSVLKFGLAGNVTAEVPWS